MSSTIKKSITKPTRPPQGHKEEARPSWLPTKPGRTTIEEAACNRWCEKPPLLQALTHPSYSETEGHKGLEPLENDAVGFRVSGYTEASPGQLTDIRSALINNNHPFSLLNGPRKPVTTQLKPQEDVAGNGPPGVR